MTNHLIDLSKQHTLKMRLRERVHDQKAAMILSGRLMRFDFIY